MALTREQKTKQINDIKTKLSNQKSIVFIDFNKVPSKDMFGLRKSLKEAGCNLKIAKKTLIRIAFGQSKLSFWNKIKPAVPGQVALVLGVEDEIAPARISNTFAKTHENFKILGGIFPAQGGPATGRENRFEFIDKARVLELASIPPRNELLGRLVGSIYSPVTSFVRVLDKIRESKNN
jgi:large subunit ribosomal protein L10